MAVGEHAGVVAVERILDNVQSKIGENLWKKRKREEFLLGFVNLRLVLIKAYSTEPKHFKKGGACLKGVKANFSPVSTIMHNLGIM